MSQITGKHQKLGEMPGTDFTGGREGQLSGRLSSTVSYYPCGLSSSTSAHLARPPQPAPLCLLVTTFLLCFLLFTFPPLAT